MERQDAVEADVVVVGAGLAGLTAARDVIAAGSSAVVVEARDRVGGRLLNHPIGDGKVVEVGGQWIGPTQDRVAALARDVGVATFPTHEEGRNVFLHRGRTKTYSGTIPPLNPVSLFEVQRAQGKLDKLARTVPLDAPWEAPGAAELDGQTAGTWLRRHIRTRTGRELMEMAIESVWAAQAEEISLLHLLFYIASAGNLDLLWDTGGGAQQDRFEGGSQLLAIRLAEQLGDAVHLASPVRRIAHGKDGVEVQADGLTARGRRAVVALSPSLAGRIAYDPPLPGYRDQLTQRMPLGTVAKCMAIYDEPFWRAEGLSGQGASTTGPVKLTYDNSPPDGSPGVLLAFLEGTDARQAGLMAPDDRREAVLGCLRAMFGERAGRPRDYVERLWAEEEWSRGCYGGHMPTGAWTAFGPALREPIGPIHWAAAETATVWNGYMDGAVSSGERAAREALRPAA